MEDYTSSASDRNAVGQKLWCKGQTPDRAGRVEIHTSSRGIPKSIQKFPLMVTESHVSDGTFLLAARETRDGKKGVSAPETDAGKRRRHRHRKTTERNGEARGGSTSSSSHHRVRRKMENREGGRRLWARRNMKDEKMEERGARDRPKVRVCYWIGEGGMRAGVSLRRTDDEVR